MKQCHSCLVALHTLFVSLTVDAPSLRSTVEISNRASPLCCARLQSSSQFRQAFTFCTNTYFQLNLSCFPSLDSRMAFLQSPQFDLFFLDSIRCNCWWFSKPQLCGSRQRRGGTGAVCTCIRLVQSNTGVGNLHTHPLAIAVVGTKLISQSSGTAFSLCV